MRQTYARPHMAQRRWLTSWTRGQETRALGDRSRFRRRRPERSSRTAWGRGVVSPTPWLAVGSGKSHGPAIVLEDDDVEERDERAMGDRPDFNRQNRPPVGLAHSRTCSRSPSPARTVWICVLPAGAAVVISVSLIAVDVPIVSRSGRGTRLPGMLIRWRRRTYLPVTECVRRPPLPSRRRARAVGLRIFR
jgi:hypothetical protein